MSSSLPKALLVAGTHSGCGKTTVSLALMAALVGRGIRVQPFKAGPDFIDPGHHEAVTGMPSHNLDTWMLATSKVQEVFTRHLHGKQLGIVEGAMGLFDGFSGNQEQGSAAHLAKVLGIPVVLVVDVSGMARSVAATVTGYVDFDPNLAVAGIIFNKVGSSRHEELVRQAMQTSLPHIPVLACLPKQADLTVPSRHLGLIMAQEVAGSERTDKLAAWMNRAMDVEKVMALLPPLAPISPVEVPVLAQTSPCPPAKVWTDRVRIGVAKDEAFCFYYRENLLALERAGAELIAFSPLAHRKLPSNLKGLYLGGGYPERYAKALADNHAMRQAIKEFSQAGYPVYAECGGFMYLMQRLRDKEGREYPMAGVFACSCAMQDRFAALGYREVITQTASILGPARSRFRGHEFHYSKLTTPEPKAQSIYQTTDRKGERQQEAGLLKNRTLGSYIHLHFRSNPSLAVSFVRACTREEQA